MKFKMLKINDATDITNNDLYFQRAEGHTRNKLLSVTSLFKYMCSVLNLKIVALLKKQRM